MKRRRLDFYEGEEFLGGISWRNFLARGVDTAPYFVDFTILSAREGRRASRLVEHCQNERCIFEFTSWNCRAGQQH